MFWGRLYVIMAPQQIRFIGCSFPFISLLLEDLILTRRLPMSTRVVPLVSISEKVLDSGVALHSHNSSV